MAYDLNRIRKAISEGKNSQALTQAKLQQQRIKFHTERRFAFNNAPDIGTQVTQFLAWVENLLPHDKFEMFKTLFRYPVKTNEVTGVCFDKLSRIFDGRNPVQRFQFANTDFNADWEDYRLARLREPLVWQTKGWEYFKSEINSVLVVDLAENQTTELPEPYFYWLTIDRVITYEADSNGDMKFIVFRDNDRIVVIDDYSYRVWNDEKRLNKLDGMPLYEHPHNLGFCPARFFWDESVDVAQPDIKLSPLTSQLESLDWYLFFHLSKRHLDLHGAYPIYSGYEQACDYSNEENGDFCDGGFLKNKQGHYKLDNAGLLFRCPKCGNKRIIGAGSFVEIPIPNAEENQPDLRNPVQMLTADRNSLDYNVGECERLRREIITNVVGQDETVFNKEAINEQQVMATFESQSTILNRIKKGFESAQMWVDDTICRLRYGENYISCYINYGTDFFLSTSDQLRAKYKLAKDSGASETELDALQQSIIDTEFRNNPTAKQRMDILKELEPYSHLTKNELIDLFKAGLIDSTDLRIKLDFSNLIRRFERENINIVEFGSNIPLATKIANIKEALRGYVAEQTEQ